jgi:hypothetical protein
MSSSFYSLGQLSLMLGTIPGDPSGDDLPPLGNKPAQKPVIFIIDDLYLLLAKSTSSFLFKLI